MYLNILANYVGRAWSLGAIFLLTPIFIKILGIESYAIIAFYSIILTFSSLADAGLSVTFSREVARHGEGGAWLLKLLATMERILLVSTFTLAISLAFAAPWIAQHWLNDSLTVSEATTTTAIVLMAFTIPAQMLMTFYQAGLMGMQRQVASNGIQALFTLVRLAGVVPVIVLKPDVTAFFVWQLCTTILFAILTRALLLRQAGLNPLQIGRFDLSSVRGLLTFSGGMLAISIISSINTQIDKLIVSQMFSVSEFGFYTLSASLAQAPSIATIPIMVAIFPKMTELISKNNLAEADLIYTKYSIIVTSISATCAILIILFTKEILNLWLYGAILPDYMTTTTKVFAVGGFFLSVASLPFYLGIANNHNKTSILLGIFTTIIIIPLISIGIYYLGLEGASFSWMFLNMLSLLILSYVIHKFYYHRSMTIWWTKCVIIPVFLIGIILLVSRFISHRFISGDLINLLFGFVFGLIALALLYKILPRLIHANSFNETISNN
jgi:O-antigen/teichoic acid export membrane protein